MAETRRGKVIITGSAGLVGQNLVFRLKAKGFTEIVAIDKHPTNIKILEKHHPSIRVLCRNLARTNPDWVDEFAGCETLIVSHAQIGGEIAEEFVQNNIVATERVLDAAVQHKVPYIIGISSSVVNSMAVDNYTETKKAQESLVAACGIPHVTLRPTLMFGLFDRKHLGWLARFMRRVPVFPIPGSGMFLRQPLFVGDFCEIIISSILNKTTGSYNITGLERINYIDLIRAVKKATGARARIQCVPYSFFKALLKVNAVVDKNPAFTVGQLEALITPDIFEVIDWPRIFSVRATPLQQALDMTFRDPVYSKVTLDF